MTLEVRELREKRLERSPRRGGVAIEGGTFAGELPPSAEEIRADQAQLRERARRGQYVGDVPSSAESWRPSTV